MRYRAAGVGMGITMENQLTDMQKISSRVNSVLSVAMLGFSIAAFIINKRGVEIAWICVCIVLTILDFLLAVGVANQHRKAWVVFRSIELVVIYVIIFFDKDMMVQAFCAFFLLLLLCQLVFSFDYSDSITKVLTIVMWSIPGIVLLIFSILLKNSDLMGVFDSFILAVCSCIMGVCVCNVSISELGKLEKKLFAQYRLVDSVNEINEELKNHQEKVKKANEELGVQKIKLEAAYNRVNSANAEMILQNEILKAITSVIEIDKLLAIMTKSLKRELSLSCCAILLRKNLPELDDDFCMAEADMTQAETEALCAKIRNGCLDRFLVCPDGFADNNIAEGRYDFLPRQEGSLLVLPMLRDGAAVGGLLAVHEQPDFFLENRVFFDTVMSQFMIALDNAVLYAKMQHMATHDGLTGLHNRGHLNLWLEKALEGAKEKKKPLSLALMDIDHFKKFNDTYGHLFGDLVIKSVAGQAKLVAKGNGGFAARYGGEEFVVAFPEKTVEECCRYVEQIRAGIEALQLEYEGVYVTVHVSVGITGYPECCTDRNLILKHADAAMYYSKEHGRNRVTVDSAEVLSQVGLMAEGME